MDSTQLQELCERGQELLMATRYWEAERALAAEIGLYVETFLAATYPIYGADVRAVAIVPTEDVALPSADRPWAIDELFAKLPGHSILLSENELPRGSRKGTTQTYAHVM